VGPAGRRSLFCFLLYVRPAGSHAFPEGFSRWEAWHLGAIYLRTEAY